jgi:hypothetical protein
MDPKHDLLLSYDGWSREDGTLCNTQVYGDYSGRNPQTRSRFDPTGKEPFYVKEWIGRYNPSVNGNVEYTLNREYRSTNADAMSEYEHILQARRDKQATQDATRQAHQTRAGQQVSPLAACLC